MSDLAHFDVAGKRVFLRCDLNVPLKSGIIKDDGRIKASLPTIHTLLARVHRLSLQHTLVGQMVKQIQSFRWPQLLSA